MLFILLLLWFFFQICLQFVLATIQIEWFFFEIWPATKYPTVNSRSETVLFDFSLMLTTTLFY